MAIVLDAPFHRQPEIDKQRPLVNGPFAVVELRRILWRSDVNVDFQLRINKAVNKLRDVLDDTHQSPCYIETVPKHGYRFIAELEGSPRTRPRPSYYLFQTAAPALKSSTFDTIVLLSYREIGR